MMDNLHLLEGHEAAAHHFIERGKNEFTFSSVSTISMTIGRSIESRRIFAVWMRLAAPKTHRSAQHGRAGQMQFARLEHDRLIKRLMMPAIAFAEKDSQENRVGR